jgi:hypothetical protein
MYLVKTGNEFTSGEVKGEADYTDAGELFPRRTLFSSERAHRGLGALIMKGAPALAQRF